MPNKQTVLKRKKFRHINVGATLYTADGERLGYKASEDEWFSLVERKTQIASPETLFFVVARPFWRL